MVLSEQGIYVSRLTGHDTKTCGKVSSPCRSISYGIQQLSTGLYIYLDGTDTLEDPYACQALDPAYPGILLNKSASFVSVKSRAYISCHHGNHWLVDGTRRKHGIRISFTGLTFLYTSIQLFDAFVTIDDTVFAKTKHISLTIEVVHQPRFDLSLNNVVFEKNTACMIISSKSSKVFVNITDTVFYENGNPDSKIPSILWLDSFNTSSNIQLRNCSFEKNTFKEYGIIAVGNVLGATNVLLKQLRLKENWQTNPNIKKYTGLFRFISAQLVLKLEYGFIYKTTGTFLYVSSGQLAEINILNLEMNEFYSGSFGGVVSVAGLYSCYLSIKNSLFRNGNNYGFGGILFILAKNSTITIQNSTNQNISSSESGGALYIQSNPENYPQSTNLDRNFIVFLRIINSSFSNSSSGKGGGALCVVAPTLSAIIQDSSFQQCNATASGGALYFSTNDNATIRLHNSYFQKNSVQDGAIVHMVFTGRRNDSSFNVSITNVAFLENRLRSQKWIYGVVYFGARSRKMTVDFKNTYFIKNFAEGGSTIFINCFGQSRLCFLTLDSCIFRNNVGYPGMVFVASLTSITCKHSIFDSNGPEICSTDVTTFLIHSNDSMIFIINTTFVNNFCQTIYAKLGGISTLTITDSVFIRNKNIDRSGGNLILISDKHRHDNDFHASITRTLFQENLGHVGSVLSVTDAKVVFTNCTFLNNFALFQGGLIYNTISSSVDLSIFHSVFRQTIPKIVSGSTKQFMATSFLRLFSPTRLTIVNTTFDQRAKSNDPLILVSTANEVWIDNTSLSSCPLGYNIEKTYYGYKSSDNTALIGLIFSCEECDYNFYSLQRGTTRGFNVEDDFQCLPCPRGADCVPAIKSKTNYWGYHTSSNPPKLAFTLCPFGYCKSPATNSIEYNACYGKRTGVMCGICSQGYTEALWSTYCTPVKDCNDYWFWFLFLTLVFPMAIILVFKPPFVTYCFKQIFWFRRRSTDTQANHDIIPSYSHEEARQENNISLSSTHQLKQDKRQFSRFVDIIFYFYQIAQLLLSSSSLKEFFNSQFRKPVLGFFNFQPSFTKQGFLCLFPGLTAESKLVFKIAPVFGTLIAIFFIYALHYFICRTRGATRPAIAPYFQACIKTVFLGYVTMAAVSISLIRCVFVANESRWFYNGNIICYQWWQYASFVFIAIFVIPFIFVLAMVSFKLHHDKIAVRQFLLAIIFPLPFCMLWLFRFSCSSPEADVEENQNVNALKEMLLAPYRQPDDTSKRGALYWQSVLIARRFVLVLIFCFVVELSIRLFCMTIVCVVVLYCHVKVRPFQNSLANNLESLSLFFLIILGLVNLFKSVFVGSKENIKGSLITVLKIFQWLETVILGLFPAALLLLLSFATISFSLRVLVICCRPIFKFLFEFRPCTQRWMSHDSSPLLNVCDNTEDDV